MTTGSRAIGRRLSPVALALLAAGAAAAPTAAQAADACPNAAVRALQGAERLPDCRAYELVSPVSKNGNAIRFSVLPRAQGDAVTYWSTGAFADAQSNVTGLYRGQRTDEGWETVSLSPPTLRRPPMLMDQPYLLAMSQDFSRALVETRYPVDENDQALGRYIDTGQVDVYRREVDGAFTWMSAPSLLPDRELVEVAFGAASADLERVVVRTAKPLLSGVPVEAQEQVYLRDGDRTSLVSVGTDGRPLPDGAVVGRNTDSFSTTGSASTVGGMYPTAVSADASTIFFADRNVYVNQPQLYVRTGADDPATAQTRLVSASQATATSGAPCASEARFLAATDDGATVLFGCVGQLTDDATASGGIYAYDVEQGALRLVAPSTGPLVQGMELVATDERAEYVWFVSGGVLADGATQDAWNLYVLHGRTVRLVATLDFGDDTGTANGVERSAVSPDGSKLAFSATTQLDARAAGTEQAYLAEAGGDAAMPVAISCVSCHPDGSPSAGRADLHRAGVDDFLQAGRTPPRGNVDDAGRVFFTSTDALVAEDRNDDVADVYEYRDGRLRLLSTGTADTPTVLAGASADGADVFLITSQSLVPQDVDNSVADIYSARVGGGFVPPATPPVCGEDCQGPPRPLPPASAPETETFRGPGDRMDPVPPRVATPSLRPPRLGARQRARLAAGDPATLVVRCSHPGEVRATLRARLGRRVVRIADAARTAARGGSVRLRLRLSRRARTHLARHRRLRVTLTVRHARVAEARRTTLTLRAPAGKGKAEDGGRR